MWWEQGGSSVKIRVIMLGGLWPPLDLAQRFVCAEQARSIGRRYLDFYVAENRVGDTAILQDWLLFGFAAAVETFTEAEVSRCEI